MAKASHRAGSGAPGRSLDLAPAAMGVPFGLCDASHNSLMDKHSDLALGLVTTSQPQREQIGKAITITY